MPLSFAPTAHLRPQAQVCRLGCYFFHTFIADPSPAASQTSAPGTDDSSQKVTPTVSNTQTGDQPKSTNLNTAGITKTDGKASGTNKGSNQATTTAHKTFPLEDPVGGVSMQVPSTMITPTPLYMIGDNVTFSWNYTSLMAKPTAIDVLLSCSVNQATWTLTANMTFETNVDYVWNSRNTNNDPDSPLLTDMYTMIIKDTNVEVTDTPEPGYLGSWTQLQFGMYANQKYLPYNEWTCPGSCSAAPPGLAPHALGLLLPMAVITVCSFTWFVTGLGLI